MNSPRQFTRSVRFIYHLTLITAVLSFLLMIPLKARAQISDSYPQMPQQFLYTSYPNEGTIINVQAGSNLQDALNDAKSKVGNSNVTIKLPAGSTFTPITDVSFNLDAVQTNGHWIIIRSDSTAFDRTGSIPPGMRVNGLDTSQTNQMAKIRVTTNKNPAFKMPSNANHYRLVGLDVGAQSDLTFTYQLIELGSDLETSASMLPHDVIVDRCYVHGNGVNGINIRHAITMNGNSLSVIDSYISDIHDSLDADTSDPEDSQAINITNGQGPFKIVNNYLEAATENMLIGGGDPRIQNLVPSDIEIQHNRFSKPTAWKGVITPIKNILELKNASRVLINGNIFENMWADNGNTAIVFTPKNQSGNAPWSTVQDVSFTNNIVRHVANGIFILTQDNENGHLSQPATRIQVNNNLFDDINKQAWGGSEIGIDISKWGSSPGHSFNFDHNTFILKNGGMGLVFEAGTQVNGFNFTSNITDAHILGGPNGDVGTQALTLASTIGGLVTWVCQYNLIVANTRGSEYPTPNQYPASYSNVGFVNYSQGDYHLSAGSQYKGYGGTDPGCNIDVVKFATAVAEKGNASPDAPAAPCTLSLTNSLLSWTDCSNNETGFRIEMQRCLNEPWGPLATVASNTTSYDLGPSAQLTSVSYRVRATGPNGDSAPSPVVFKKPACYVDYLYNETGPLLTDDFNDNYMDSTKWTISLLNKDSSQFDPNVTVIEQNGQLQITPIANATGNHYSGYVSTQTWDMTGLEVSVEAAQVTNGPGMSFVIGSDYNNWYRIAYSAGSLLFESQVGGQRNTASITYDSVQHRFWRMRHEISDDRIIFETSPNRTDWTVQATSTRQFDITALRIELSAGTYQEWANPGTAIFDNLRLEPTFHTAFSDNFDDNARDTTKWNLGVLNVPPEAYNSGVTVLEQNQRLEITPIANTDVWSHNGYVSAATYNFTGARASVQVPQVPTGGTALAIFTVGIDSNNWYRITTKAGQLYFQDMVGGVKNSTNITYNATLHRYWRIQHNAGTDTVDFLTSSDGVTWTTQRSGVARQISINAIRLELDAGTYESVSAPGTAIFDDFTLEQP